MHKTTEILTEIEGKLLSAEIRIASINSDLSSEENVDLIALTKELERVHSCVIRLENTLLRKIIFAARTHQKNTQQKEN